VDNLRDHASRFDRAAANLTDAASELAAAVPSEQDFGADGPGLLGEVGLALYGHWAAVTDARVREATLVADLLLDTADALRLAAESYADTDDAARRRHAEEN
jgi:hypothetical protein